MLIVIGRVGCAAGKRDELVEAMRAMEDESRQEPGCIRYGFYASVEDPDQFIAVEEWESKEALENHFGAPSVAGFGSKLGGLIAGTPTVDIHHVEKTTDFPNLD
jgi:quinol monooxygenase YgiN